MHIAILTTLLLALAATPGDWLVTTDGDRIETRGPWQVEGRRVVFTLPNGTLSAVRLERVDLEASRAANRPPTASAAEPPREAKDRPPALVLGIGDVARHTAASKGEGEPASAETPARVDLHVARWEDVSTTDDRGLRFRGLITNAADTFAAGIELEVTLLAEDGQVIDTRPARLARPALDVQSSTIFQSSTSFEAFFPDQYSYDRVHFELDALQLLRPDPPVESTEETEPTEGSLPAAPRRPPGSGDS